jgi:hypothetical protein
LKVRTASGAACRVELKVRMRIDEGWAQCRLELVGSAPGDHLVVVEETGSTATGAVARAAGVLIERLRDQGYEATFEEVLGAIEQAIAGSIVRRETGARPS